MDFQKLLSVASQIQSSAKEQDSSRKFMSTKMSAPKKVQPKAKGVQSAAVRAFLQKKEEEEKQKEIEEKRKKRELLALRAEAKHKSKAHAMASRTKDNFKNLLSEDAPVGKLPNSELYSIREEENGTKDFIKHSERKAHTAELKQKLSEEKRKEMMEKVARVAQRLAAGDEDQPEQTEKGRRSSQEEEEVDDLKEPRSSKKDKSHKHDKDKSHRESRDKSDKHDRHKSGKHDKSSDKTSDLDPATVLNPKWVSVKTNKNTDVESKKPKKAPKPGGSGPLSFEDLIALAQKKSTGPVPEEKEVIKKPKLPTKKEPERPLTQEEKNRLERKKTKEYQDWYKYGKPLPSQPPSASSKKRKSVKGDTVSQTERSAKQSSRTDGSKGRDGKDEPATSKSDIAAKSTVNPTATKSTPATVTGKVAMVKDSVSASKATKRPDSGTKAGTQPGKSGERSGGSTSVKSQPQSSGKAPKTSETLRANSDIKKSASESKYAVEHENVLVCGPSAAAPEKPMSVWDRIYSQVRKEKPQDGPGKRKRPVLDSSEEEDEEMDDFIVDDEELDDFIDDSEVNDYSKHIREIFNYDRNRFQDDDDDGDMEVSYAQQMKEEKRSARIGLQEDLEDIRMEQEEMKRKAAKKKALLAAKKKKRR